MNDVLAVDLFTFENLWKLWENQDRAGFSYLARLFFGTKPSAS
jgi:hypothetical protein